MTTASKLTLGQFLSLPETEPASEYVCGEVLQKPMPTGIHALLQLYLASLLVQFLSVTKLGKAGTEWRCVFGPPGRERAFVPDIVFIAREHLPTDASALLGPFEGAPDLVVEVLSPGQPMGRFAEKLQFYLQYGVRLVWVVDPIARTISVLAAGEEPRTLSGGETVDGGTLLPGFLVLVDDVFAQMQV